MKNIGKIAILFILVSSIFVLSGCNIFKDVDDFPVDGPIEIIEIEKDEPVNEDVKEDEKILDNENQTEEFLDSGEIEKNIEELINELEEDVNEELKDDNKADTEEVKEDIKTDTKEDVKEETKPEPQTQSTPKSNASSFADSARWSTFDNYIKIGEAGKVKLMNSVQYKIDGTDIDGAMKVEKILTDDEVLAAIKKYNANSTIDQYPEKKTNYDWHGVKVLFDLKDYPTDGGEYLFVPPTITINSEDNFPYFYMDGKPYYTMESFKVRLSEPPFEQGDILEYYYIFTLPEGYTKPAFFKVINTYDNIDNQYSYFKIF